MDLYTWAIVIFVLIATLTAIFLFIKTPKSERTQEYATNKRSSYLEKKFASYPESAQAVIIQGNKRQALSQIFPYFLIMTPFIVFTIYINYAVEDPLCHFIFGVNTALIAMLILLCALPIMLLIVSFNFVRSALKTIKTGYFPPLDSIQFVDKIAVKTTYSKLIGYFIVLFLPLTILFVLYSSYSAVMSMTDNEPLQFFQEKNEMICEKGFDTQGLKYD